MNIKILKPITGKIFLLTALLAITGCDKHSQEEVEPQVTTQSGEALIQQYCIACHLPPEPQDLPASRWPFVLRWMGCYVGMNDPETFKGRHLLKSDLVATAPIMSQEEWTAIGEYLTKNGAKELAPDPLLPNDELFHAEKFTPDEPGGARMITAIHFDHNKLLHVAEGGQRMVYRYNQKGEFKSLVGPLGTEVVGAFSANGALYYTLCGHLVSPGNKGAIVKASDTWKKTNNARFPRLARARAIDVDADGHDELLLAAFGDDAQGALILASLGANGKITDSRVLVPLRGCTEAMAIDLEGDGDQDILALFTQGRQDLWALVNDGAGNFTARIVFRRRPSWGFTGFEIADLDEDGNPDLIAYAGNNLEHLDPPTRPYHGLHFFKGDGKGEFKEQPQAFIHLPGATAVRAGDWDLDGKIDLVAGAMILDWRTDSAVGAITVKNLGGFQFETRLLTHAPIISIETADVDNDGDLDLFLGLFPSVAYPEMPKEEVDRATKVVRSSPALHFFRNEAKKKQ